MRFIVRAVIYGFAFSLGAALFKKVQDRIGLGEPKEKERGREREKEKEQQASEPEAVREAPPEPNLPS